MEITCTDTVLIFIKHFKKIILNESVIVFVHSYCIMNIKKLGPNITNNINIKVSMN